MQQPIRFEDLIRPLTVSELSPTPAEAHGMLLGLLSAGSAAAERCWLDEVLAGADPADLAVAECRGLLRRLAAQTRDQLADQPELLLPDASAGSQAMAAAIVDWVRGFLFGISIGGLDPAAAADDGLSANAKEAIDDLLDITRLDLDSIGAGEADEAALTEITEFIRVAAMLVYEDVGRPELGGDIPADAESTP
jgi:yecA family protein